MQIQINSDNVISLGDESRTTLAEMIAARLERFSDRLTRVEAHFVDVDGRERQGTADKRCLLEARPAGRDPVAVTAEADSLDQALAAALPKLITTLEREFGRITSRKGH